MTRPRRGRKIAGLLLVLLGCLAFVFVADDLRHTGELGGAAALLGSGLVLLAAESGSGLARRWPLHWIAVGIGLGVGAGVLLDRFLAGVGCGAILGALGTVVLGSRTR
jgi:hypothetical protein